MKTAIFLVFILVSISFAGGAATSFFYITKTTNQVVSNAQMTISVQELVIVMKSLEMLEKKDYERTKGYLNILKSGKIKLIKNLSNEVSERRLGFSREKLQEYGIQI